MHKHVPLMVAIILAVTSATGFGEGTAVQAISPPAAGIAKAEQLKGYLNDDSALNIKAWMPPAPAAGSDAEKADFSEYLAKRVTLKTERGQMAAEDDVSYNAQDQLLVRFNDAAGVTLNQSNVPTLYRMLPRLKKDAERLLGPIKRPVVSGGRIRPFVANPDQPSCIAPVDMANHRQDDLGLDRSGSYPSGHAFLGMTLALILSEADPKHADDVLHRGIEFGESRLICGFHYPSDLVAGRLAAAALFARLHANPDFQADMSRLKHEFENLQSHSP